MNHGEALCWGTIHDAARMSLGPGAVARHGTLNYALGNLLWLVSFNRLQLTTHSYVSDLVTN